MMMMMRRRRRRNRGGQDRCYNREPADTRLASRIADIILSCTFNIERTKLVLVYSDLLASW